MSMNLHHPHLDKTYNKFKSSYLNKNLKCLRVLYNVCSYMHGWILGVLNYFADEIIFAAQHPLKSVTILGLCLYDCSCVLYVLMLKLFRCCWFGCCCFACKCYSKEFGMRSNYVI